MATTTRIQATPSPINVDPEIMSGTPVFAGTRVPIKNLFDYLQHERTIAEFLEHFPSVTREQVMALLALACTELVHGATTYARHPR